MDEPKLFNDAVHGHIGIEISFFFFYINLILIILELHPLLIKVIDTRQFQRLRNIKQMGAAYLVYPTACHNRFEHSIGTCHLANQLIQSLKRKLDADRNLNIEISEKDEFCVLLAALCHDLGHGPLSHMFDGGFLSKYQEYERRHEDISVDMLRYLIEENNLMEEFKKRFPSFNENDITFVNEMIKGPDEFGKYKGRTDIKLRLVYIKKKPHPFA